MTPSSDLQAEIERLMSANAMYGFGTELEIRNALRELAAFCYQDAEWVVLDVGVDFSDRMYQCALRDTAKALARRAKEMKG